MNPPEVVPAEVNSACARFGEAPDNTIPDGGGLLARLRRVGGTRSRPPVVPPPAPSVRDRSRNRSDCRASAPLWGPSAPFGQVLGLIRDT